MNTLKFRILLLVVLVLGMSCAAVNAQFMNEPNFIAGLDGQQWDHCVAYNPERNEFLVTYYDLHTGQRR